MKVFRRLASSPIRGDLILLLRIMQRTDSRRMSLIIVLGVVLALTEGLSLLLLVPILNGLDGSGVNVSSWPAIGSLTDTIPLIAVLALLVLVVAVRSLVAVYRDRSVVRLRLEVLDRQREAALEAALHARWSWLAGRRASHIVQTVNTEVARVGVTVDLIARLSVGVLIALTIAVVAIVIAPVAGTIATVLALAVAIVLLPTAKQAHRLGTKQIVANREYASSVTDVVGAIKLVRAEEASDRWLVLLRQNMERMASIQIHFSTRSSAQQAALTTGSAIAASAMVLIAIRFGTTADQLIVLVVLVSRLLTTVQGLGLIAQQAANFLPAVATVNELLQDAARHADPVAAVNLPSSGSLPKGPLQVEARDITFGYEENPILRGVSLTCPAGSLTAITGPSGVGKSTLIDVLIGLLAPQQGHVTIGGHEASAMVTREFRSRLGYVPQDVHLLPGTLRENLTWPCEQEVSDDDARRALAAVAADFVLALPDGLDTLLGERGVRFSGGQRQRIAIAGAILRRPDFLVLDEATNALDAASELEVLSNLKDLGTTVVLVAHRSSTLSLADSVFDLQQSSTAGP